MTETAENILDRFTQPAKLERTLPDGRIQCLACAHMCKLTEGRRGICKVRFTQGGKLMAPWGYVAGMQPDPIEKKPFFHVLPGATALTFGMLGCNFHCDNCQNWFTSQVLRDPNCEPAIGAMRSYEPGMMHSLAKQTNAQLLVSSYNEPFITTEWAAVLFDAAREQGMLTAVVSNGYASLQSLQLLAPRLNAIKIDLKSNSDLAYRKLGGVLGNVLSCIDNSLALGIWLEVVSLIIPGFNDQPDDLYAMARLVAERSPDIPWHVTAFVPQYRNKSTPATAPKTLLQAAEIGQEAGLRYVYAGNLPGQVDPYENTHCPNCGKVVIERKGFKVRNLQLEKNGICDCGEVVPGIWNHPRLQER